MKKSIEDAKNKNLNWQALLIEEAQTDIKVYIKNAILANKPFKDISKGVNAIIGELIKDLESVVLKDKCKVAMPLFAQRIYDNSVIVFGGLNKYILIALAAAAIGKANQTELSTVQEFLNIRNSNIPPKEIAIPAERINVAATDYLKNISDRVNYIAEIEAKEDYTSKVNMRNVAELQIRQEMHEEELQRLLGGGIDLVWIVPHADCSERCEKWQGKLYSISGKSGVIDGINYQPLSNATDIYVRTKAGKIYKNGCISGFGCRHKLKPYQKDAKPKIIPAAVVAKEREINNTQRRLERGIRKYRERAELINEINPALSKRYKAKAVVLNKNYVNYSRNNGAAYYPERVQI